MLCIFPDHLDLFEYQSPNRGTDSLFFCNTEYIPDDVPAAPATGMVETIITLAALAGSDSIRAARNEVSGLPTAHGSNVQLSFREHAQLGSVAILQKCPGPNTYHEYVAIRESEAWIFFKFNSKRRYRKMMIPKVILQYYLPVDPMLLKDNYVFSVTMLHKAQNGVLLVSNHGSQVATCLSMVHGDTLRSRRRHVLTVKGMVHIKYSGYHSLDVEAFYTIRMVCILAHRSTD
jgi:hypothetical protein